MTAAEEPARLVRLGIRVRAEQAETALADLLPVLCGGAEERDLGGAVEYAIYGPPGELPPPEAIRALAGDALLGTVEEPVREGWDRRYLEHLRPIQAGRFTIRAPWLDGAPDDLIIDPGTAFGAGTHPTTRLCLELLCELEPRGALADWGSGSGVLAVAAARLGFGPVHASELDPAALPVIEANAAANGVALTAATADLTAAGGAAMAPTVTANLTAALHPLVAATLGSARPARLIASGLLVRDAPSAATAYGMRELDRRTEGDWAAVLLG
ncbi:MAG: ribosomal protein methyltransferase [Solirubrobacteraceae bacterium]|nr:ribosomal protein methyltransferase [Solirubrobacteraceae bacterium]